MADFCKQCSIEHFGQDFNNLANLTKPEDAAQDRYAMVICEGCGPTQVNPDGSCTGNVCNNPDHRKKVKDGKDRVCL